jgi:hypothetical protein
MSKVSYKLSISGWSVDSSSDARTELLELETISAIGSPAGWCRIAVYAPSKADPSLLEQAAGAALSAVGLGGANGAGGPKKASTEIRGQKVSVGDKVSLELTSGDKSGTVMTAELRSIQSSLGQTVILARTSGHRLATTRLNQVYQNQSAKQIATDAASQAGVTAGDMDDGSTYSYLVVHESRNTWEQVRDLAVRDGLDVYFDASNQLTLKKFQKTTPDHTLYFGIDVLDLDLLRVEPSSEHVFVYGESPSSNTGSDTWYWMTKDLQPFRGEAGNGVRMLTVSDSAIRTKDASAACATARFGAIGDGSTLGRLRLLGDPTIKLGDSIEIKKVPNPDLNGVFKVISVRHVYNKFEGFTTVVGFSGKGSADQAGGALGQLAGTLAGAVGL